MDGITGIGTSGISVNVSYASDSHDSGASESYSHGMNLDMENMYG